MTDYVFYPLVPTTGHNPSNDYTLMQTNNASTNGIIGTDHITFNANNGGQHMQVTFNTANAGYPFIPVSTVPPNPPVLFVQNIGFLPQLFYYSGDAAHGSSQYVSASSGSTFLLGGIVLKWGQFTTSGSPYIESFVNSFPNSVYSVVLTPINSGGVGNYRISTFSPGDFTVVTPSGSSFYYIAIGS